MPKLIGILGGTFDPIHLGHLAMANKVAHTFQIEKILFIPCNNPWHRKTKPQTNAAQRTQMVKLAIEEQAKFELSTLELDRPGLTYTIDTLKELRQQYPDDTLCVILGEDAFASLNQWREHEKLFDYAHILCIKRPNHQLPAHKWMQTLLTQHQCQSPEKIQQQRSGLIYFLEHGVSSISATKIRDKLKHHESIKDDVPDNVYRYIQKHHLYQ